MLVIWLLLCGSRAELTRSEVEDQLMYVLSYSCIDEAVLSMSNADTGRTHFATNDIQFVDSKSATLPLVGVCSTCLSN